jgi:ankyrin repeat protein
MNQRLIRILGGTTEHYPYALEGKFPRILETIMSLWDDDEIDNYFMELMVSKRPDRAGFSPDVAADIMRLSLIHAAQEAPDKHKDIWELNSDSFVNFTPHHATDWPDLNQSIKSELDKYNIPCTPEGFFEASETGNRAAVALFLEAKISTEIRDNRGWTPLMLAAFNGRDEIIDMLIQNNADVNSLDQGGNSALHWAAFGGHLSSAKRLIEHHARINEQNSFGWTPLIEATARNHLNIVTLLIESGANLDTAAGDGYTALHKAAASGFSEIVKLLLAQGSDRNIRAIDGGTPYELAIKSGQEDVIKLLMPSPGSETPI